MFLTHYFTCGFVMQRSDGLQSINQNLYSTPSRSLLRGAPDPGQAEKNRCLRSIGRPFQVVGPTTWVWCLALWRL